MTTEQTTGEERVRIHNKKMSKRYNRGLFMEKAKEEINDKDKKAPSS